MCTHKTKFMIVVLWNPGPSFIGYDQVAKIPPLTMWSETKQRKEKLSNIPHWTQ